MPICSQKRSFVLLTLGLMLAPRAQSKDYDRDRPEGAINVAVLVIGGVGYIGSHAARSLKRYGYEVLIYDNFSTGFPFLAKGFELITSDVTWLPETFRSNEEGRLGDALCGTFLYRRICRKPAKIFAQQCGRWTGSSEHCNRGRSAQVDLLVDVRAIRRASQDSDHGRHSAPAGESLWNLQALL